MHEADLSVDDEDLSPEPFLRQTMHEASPDGWQDDSPSRREADVLPTAGCTSCWGHSVETHDDRDLRDKRLLDDNEKNRFEIKKMTEKRPKLLQETKHPSPQSQQKERKDWHS